MKLRVGNSANAKLNGEWGGHAKKWVKKITSRLRRIQGKNRIREEMIALQE